MSAINFKVIGSDGTARRGRLHTPHGAIETPAFIPVGTLASVKALGNGDLKTLSAPAMLANTYHLLLRPGPGLIKRLGGLHAFTGWNGPIVTDSGGFQVFSLGFGLEHGVSKISNIFPGEEPNHSANPGRARLMQIDDDGVTFASHLDGTRHRLTAERSIGIQQDLGADLIFAFDECTSPLHDHGYTAAALERTHRWAEYSLAAWTQRDTQALFGIVQGGAYQDLREHSARFIDNQEFPAVAIGGSLGRTKRDMHRILEWSVPLLDPHKPRHLLGIGEIPDLFESVSRGIDLFDCVAPTRQARNGGLYISPEAGGTVRNGFRLSLRAARYRADTGPIDPNCSCSTCQTYSRAYLRHLFATGELAVFRLATIHNLHVILTLMDAIRKAIEVKQLAMLSAHWLNT